ACRLAHDYLFLLAEVIQPKDLLDRLKQASAGRDLLCHDVTSAFAEFGLAGSKIENILTSLTALDPSALSPGSCAETNLAGIKAPTTVPAAIPINAPIAKDRTNPCNRTAVRRFQKPKTITEVTAQPKMGGNVRSMSPLKAISWQIMSKLAPKTMPTSKLPPAR